MRKVLATVFVCIAAWSAFAQISLSNWQLGTMTSVAYMVLFTAPESSDVAKYRTGLVLPVLIGQDSITFNDLLGRMNESPVPGRAKMEAQKH